MFIVYDVHHNVLGKYDSKEEVSSNESIPMDKLDLILDREIHKVLLTDRVYKYVIHEGQMYDPEVFDLRYSIYWSLHGLIAYEDKAHANVVVKDIYPFKEIIVYRGRTGREYYESVEYAASERNITEATVIRRLASQEDEDWVYEKVDPKRRFQLTRSYYMLQLFKKYIPHLLR